MTTLINQIQIVNLAPATPTAFPHGLNIDGAGLIPDRVEADDAELQINSADATNVVVENIGAAPVSGTVQASHLHTIERVIPPGLANLPVQPFIPQSGGGGGGGGVTNPLILSTGNAAVAAPVAYASGAIGHGIDGDVGTADVQVGGGLPATYSGLAIGWVDSFAGGTAQVRVAEEAALANAHVKLGGPYTGYAVAYRGCHAFGSAYAEGADAYISNYGRGSLVGGYAHGDTQYARISTYGFGSWSGGFAHGTGGYGGLILTAHDGSFAHGVAKGGYILTNFASPGSFAQGYATSGGYVRTRGVPAHYPRASFAQGYAKTNGIIEAYRDGIGSMARGYVKDNGLVRSSAKGSLASGYSYGAAGYVQASGKGAFAQGCCEGGRVRASGYGSLAVGRSTGGISSVISATAGGAMAQGYAYGNASVQATQDGAFATGRAYDGNSQVTASGDGALASGNAKTGGALFAAGYGCTAFGQVAGGGQIIAGEFGGGVGVFAGGYAEAGARIIAAKTANGEGAFAFGHAITNAYIYTKGHGSFAMGYAKAAYDIFATGNGSFAFGYANTAHIQAGAANAVQFGPGANTQVNSVQIGNAGIRFRGLVQAGDPAGVQNGDFWMVGTALWVRTGGVSKAL